MNDDTDYSQYIQQNIKPSHPKVTLAFATRVRHICINNEILCKPKFARTIRQRGDNGYNSLIVSGIPGYYKQYPDVNYPRGGGHHSDGIIPFKLLDQIEGIILSSICKACLKKYNKLLKEGECDVN